MKHKNHLLIEEEEDTKIVLK